MSLFKKKCEYCKKKIEKGQEIARRVKVPILVGIREKAFCCEEHANDYEKEVNNVQKCKSGGSCCG